MPDASEMEKQNSPDAREEDCQTDSQTGEEAYKWEKFNQYFDIGLCVVICDARMTSLLEKLLAQEITKKKNDFVEKLVDNLDDSDGAQFTSKKKEKACNLYFNKEMLAQVENLKLTIFQLECALGSMGREKMRQVVGRLRETRNEVVHEQFKFAHPSKKTKFLNDYQMFIELYFPQTSGNYQVNRNYYLEPVAISEEKAMMVEEYRRKLKELENECKDLRKKKENAIYAKRHLEENLEISDAKLAGLNEEINSLKQKKGEHTRKSAKELERKLKAKQAQFSAKNKDNLRLKSELDEQKKVLNALKTKLKQKAEELSELKKQLEQIESELGECEKTVVKLKEEVRNLKEESEALEEKLEESQNKEHFRKEWTNWRKSKLL